MSNLEPTDQRFVDQAIGREHLFLRLSIVSVIVGLLTLGLAAYRLIDGQGGGSTFVVAILILLNGRQNLRQHKYARVLRVLGAKSVDLESSNDR